MRRFTARAGVLKFSTALASTVFMAAAAHAQTNAAPPPAAPQADPAPPVAAPAAEADAGVQEIVVTAQKRQEPLSKVPIAISAVTGETLATAHIDSTNDLEKVIPGLVSNNLANTGNFWLPYIRGVGSNATGLGNSSSVATYIDGVYQPASTPNVMDLADIERVEVVKGPQGTLFGRNATGGAINIITRAPSRNFELDAEGSYGRFGETVDKLYVTGPLGPTLAGSLSYEYHGGGDYIRDLGTGGKFGGFNDHDVHGKLLWTPTDRLEVTLSGFFTRRLQTDSSQSIAYAREGGLPVPAQLGAPVNYEPRKFLANTEPFFFTRSYQGQADIRYKADGFDVVSITGYIHAFDNIHLDFDTSPAPIFFFDERDRIEAFSQEFQLVSNGTGPFKWLAGLYYSSDSEAYAPLVFGIGAPFPATADQIANSPGSQRIDTFSRSLARSYAAFAQVTYRIGASTNLTAGLRYTREERQLTGHEQLDLPMASGSGFVFTPLVIATANAKKTFEKPTWRFSIDHNFGPTTMVYASYNRGFKSGVFNTTNLAQPAVKPEVLDAYEVGLKTRTDNGMLTFNAAAFYYNYKNLQVQVTQAGQILLQNAAQARIKGLDFDAAFRPVRALTLRAGLNILDSKYRKYFNAATFLLINGAGVNGTIADASGQSLVYAPKYNYNLAADYRIGLPGGSYAMATANWSYSAKFKTVIGDNNFIRAYGTLNASLTWYARDEKFYVGVYGRNLTNVQDIGRYLNTMGLERQLIRPVTYGVIAGVKFR